MQKRRFRKLSKRISVHAIPKEQHASRSTEYDDVLFGVVDTWCNSYAEQLLLQRRIKQSNSVDWYCFNCKAEIHIHVEQLIKRGKLIRPSEFFCTNCKSHVRKSNDMMLIRYANSFYSKVKQIIKRNTHIIEYL